MSARIDGIVARLHGLHPRLIDLSLDRLRDLLEPERVHQLRHPELPDQFPPLKSLESRPNNLPRQPTPFLARERETSDVVSLLQRNDVHLLTLGGPGGTGKTRLALQAAADLLDDFADGVFFVPLASLTDPALVLSTIASTLGVHEEGGQPLCYTATASTLHLFAHLPKTPPPPCCLRLSHPPRVSLKFSHKCPCLRRLGLTNRPQDMSSPRLVLGPPA